MTTKARLQFHSLDQPDQGGELIVTDDGLLRMTFSAALSTALRESERMAREALEMGKGVGGFSLEGLALTSWGWDDALVMTLARGVPVSALAISRKGTRLTLRVRHDSNRASLSLGPGEYDEREAQEVIAAMKTDDRPRTTDDELPPSSTVRRPSSAD